MGALLDYFNEVIQPAVDELDELLAMTNEEYIAKVKSGEKKLPF
jgi:hypothetical protein